MTTTAPRYTLPLSEAAKMEIYQAARRERSLAIRAAGQTMSFFLRGLFARKPDARSNGPSGVRPAGFAH